MPIPFTLDASDCNDIRSAIDTTLSANTVTDTVITSTIYQGEAEEVIAAALASVTGDLTPYDARIKRAVKLMTAGLVAPSVPMVLGENVDNDRIQMQARDLRKLGKDLIERANDAVIRIIDDVTEVVTPADGSNFAAGLFTTAKCNPK